MTLEPTDPTVAEADAAMIVAARTYFDSRRARVDGFVATHFGLRGSLRLHSAAFGFDILRAPLNVLLSPVLVLSRLAGLLAGKLGLRRVAAWLAGRTILLPTDVARAVEALIVVDLLELPWPDGPQRTRRNALAETVLAAPQIRALLNQSETDPLSEAAGQRMARSVTEYTGTRSAVAEMTTALGTLSTGAVVLKTVTPGVVSFAPAIAAILAQNAAIAGFPLGAGLGALWYDAFPAHPPVWMTGGAIAVLVLLGSVVAAFAGVLADPVQVWTGTHRRRLLRLIDVLEAEFTGPDRKSFTAREHFLARLVDLADAGVGATRLFRG
ncbi:DUF6635 family protein [Pseudoruegeria sp. SK021]|uniref:DUF6635 family protein n=1 Tax=Pseudoruegeria sp. SK021 TaxID=1933035 RepID=UPI000A249A25|nr:DUF6635 family protein [Pseudoruegeria sp. SK021]OSP54545.1 hypothetical protein BV911_11800 [Pseudoruegeria sp. SK021]